MKNISEMLSATAERQPDKVGIVHDKGEMRWADLDRQAKGLGWRLQDQGVTRGDRVGIFIDHRPEQVVAIFGVAAADAAFTIISPILKDDQIKHQVNDADLAVIVTTEDHENFIKTVLAYRPVNVLTISLDDAPAPGEGRAIEPKNVPTDVACIIYTSGSTGKPKGVVVPHRTLLDGARIVSGYIGITEDDVLLSVLPFGFDYGFNQLLTATLKGAKIVIRKFSFPQDIVRVLGEQKVTGFAGMPSMWWHFFNPKLMDAANKPHFEHLRYITTAGGKHSQDLLQKLTAFFPETDIIIMYGLTESFRSTYLPPSELFKRPGSIGKPVPEVDILVLNEKDEPCAPGEKGELIHRGAFITYGYLNDPDLTAQKFIELKTGGPGCLPEIAVRSGDVVSLDEDGFIYFHERADMQIKCSGYRISPSQVEEVAVSVPGVKHAAAFGMPDPQLGEVVHLAYSTHAGAPVDRKTLTACFNQGLPSYAVPRNFHFFPEIPFTAHGKIDYTRLIQGAKQSRDTENPATQ